MTWGNRYVVYDSNNMKVGETKEKEFVKTYVDVYNNYNSI